MASRSPVAPREDQQLLNAIFSPEIRDDPLAFVMFAFPWGQKGTPLEHQSGPRRWQKEILQEIAEHLKDCRRRRVNNLSPEVFREAVVSGRGIGKSALVAWLVLWMLSTGLGSTTIVTANTESQLKSRTWAELGKWHTLAINAHWFKRNSDTLRPDDWFDAMLRTELKIDTAYYYAQAQLWTEDNPDAFAGVHNHNGIMVIFDEASGIPGAISNVTEGFFTEPIDRRYWLKFSNGRRNTGDFFECFHKFRDVWRRKQIDGRTVEGTDHSVYEAIIRQHGADSDAARVEVYGQFPKTGDRQLIGRDVVQAAQQREQIPDDGAPLLMGVDVARFGDDHSVIRFRRGRDARSIPKVKLKGADTVTLAHRVAELADRHQPDAIFVDGGGVGGGVVDQLKAMRYTVIEVQFGAKPNDPMAYENKRTEMWDLLAQWMLIGCVDGKDTDLADDLTAPEFTFNPVTNKKKLEPKEQTKKRGFASPDDADALAVTFAQTVARRDRRGGRSGNRARVARDVDYALFE
jgi:hypothetical protein